MTMSIRNANGSLLAKSTPLLRPTSVPCLFPVTAGPAAIAGPPLPDDRLEWTTEDLAVCLNCHPQKITYHCRQLERRGRLHKTDGVWRFDYGIACLLLKYIVDNGHRHKRGPA